MKENIIFVSTFNKKLYDQYANRLISSYENTNQEFKLYIFSEDKFKFQNKNIIYHNIFDVEPDLKSFINNNNNKNKIINYKYDAVRFSYKVFSLIAGTKFGEKIFYIDADCIFLKKIDKYFVNNFLPNTKSISYYFRKYKHPETGFFAININNTVSKEFISEYKNMYTSGNIFNLKEQHDAYVFGNIMGKIIDKHPDQVKFNGDKNSEHIIANDDFVNQFIDHTKGELRKQLGYSPERINYNGPVKNVHIIQPEVNAPWKKINISKNKYKVSEDNKKIRLNWVQFAIKLAEKIKFFNKNINTIIHQYPLWKIDENFINSFNNDIVLIPHKSKNQFKKITNHNCFFYMQDLNINNFTIDKNGWSSENSLYPIQIENISDTNLDNFEKYAKKFQTKYSQTKSILDKIILFFKLKKDYLLVPIQIPKDESIFHSKVNVELFIKRICEYCKKNKIRVILKPHPANLKETRQFKNQCDNKFILWSESDLKQLIKNSRGIMTINSAVGFEGLLLKKPVVTFGKCLYDCVAFKGNIDEIDKSIKYIIEFDIKKHFKNYRKFVNWFTGIYAFNLDDENTMLANAFKILNSYKSNK